MTAARFDEVRRAALAVCLACVPGDVLIAKSSGSRAVMSLIPWSVPGAHTMCTLPYGALALVIQRRDVVSCDLFVLCAGRLGWINDHDIEGALKSAATKGEE